MSARTKARKRALDILYSADIRGLDVADVLSEESQRAATEPDRLESWAYAHEIVTGVVANRDAIDELLQSYSRGWSLERMPAVDRALLRIASWELLYNDEVPANVAISEAVQLANELSTDGSGKFINGVLGALAQS